MLTDRSVSVHATLAELLGTGMLVLIGTGAVQQATDASAAKGLIDRAPPASPSNPHCHCLARRRRQPDRVLMHSLWCPLVHSG